ncbi:MAG: hypothetical protein AB7V42_07495 [Thermoleophilia bacterium]
MTQSAILDPAAELERATSDYLAVSRSSHLYATTADYETAERRAWERVMAAREAVELVGDAPAA